MNKNEIILKVSDSVQWLQDVGAVLSVSAWGDDGGMIDQHVTEYFDELENIGLEELQEGDMYYFDNNLTKYQMITLLKSMGFNATELLNSDL